MLEAGAQIDIWVIESALGSGGMGSVYRCHNRSASRILAAVKVLEANLRQHPEAQARFIREAEILFQLDHPNIVKVRNVRTDVDPPYLEMEFVEGESLEQRLCRGPVPLIEALPLMAQIASAIAYLHRKGVRHRDIKPANLLVKRDGRVKLVDFGLAMEADVSRITAQGMTFGTVSYAPPEWIAPETLDPAKWDLYAMGVVFYEMLTGDIAFPVSGHGSARQQAMQLMLIKQGHPPLDPGPEIPESVRALVRELTRPDPRHRLTDGDEALARLRELSSEFDFTLGDGTLPPLLEEDEDAPSVVVSPPRGFTSDEPTDPIPSHEAWSPTAIPAGHRRATPAPAPSLLDAVTAPAPPSRIARRLPPRPETGTLYPRSSGARLRMAAPLAVLGTLLAIFALGALAVVGALTWSLRSTSPYRPVDVVITGLPASVPVHLRIGELVPTQAADSVHSFARVPEGEVHITWVLGRDCPPSDCPGLSCPSWCDTGSRPIEVAPGTTPQILTLALEPPRGRDVHLLLPELDPEVPRSATLDGRLAVIDGEALVLDEVPPGRHPLVVSAGRCAPEAQGCWPHGSCPAGCTSYAGTLIVPRGTEPYVHTLDLVAPAGAPAPLRDPTASAPTGEPITKREYARWLEHNPEWQRIAAAEAGRADSGYLADWEGLRPPPGKEDHAVTHVSWHAAAAYCSAHGGLANVDAPPLRWTEDERHPWIEYRIQDGRAAWRSSDGRTSSRVNLKSTHATMGFRCAR